MRCQQVNCTPTSAGIFNVTRAPDEVQSTGGSKNFATRARRREYSKHHTFRPNLSSVRNILFIADKKYYTFRLLST